MPSLRADEVDRTRGRGGAVRRIDVPKKVSYAPAVDARDPVQESIQRRFLVAIVISVSVLFLWMIRGFLTALLMAAILAGLLYPIHRWVVAKVAGREGLAAALVVVAVFFGLVGPFSTFLAVVTTQALELSETIRDFLQREAANPDALRESVRGWIGALPFGEKLLALEASLPSREEVVKRAGQTVSTVGSMIVSGAATATKNTATFLLNLFVFLYALFFFLLRGRETLDLILYYAPLDPEAEQEVVERFLSVTRATLKGSIVIGLVQGALAGLALWLAGIPGALFWTTIMAILSVIPGVGVALVWVPAAIWLALQGELVSAGALSLWCGLVVGTVDNVLRPRLVGADAQMTDLMILLGTLGGISLFGVAGFLVGPIVAAVFVTVWELYGREFADVLPAVHSDERSPEPTETDS